MWVGDIASWSRRIIFQGDFLPAKVALLLHEKVEYKVSLCYSVRLLCCLNKSMDVADIRLLRVCQPGGGAVLSIDSLP